MASEQGGWTFIKSPEYVFARLGYAKGGPAMMDVIAQDFARRWREKLSQKGTVRSDYYFAIVKGRIQIVGRRETPHYASAPGDPPAKDTGEAANSIRVRQVAFPNQPWRVRYIVSTPLEYLAYLEYGMGPRFPFDHPAYAQADAVIEPRPHVRPLIREGFDGVDADFVGKLQGSLVPITVRPRGLQQLRRYILKYGAITGTLSPFGITPKWAKQLRNMGYSVERTIGNLEAIRDGPDAMARRARNILVGRQVGGLFSKIIGPTTQYTPKFDALLKRRARVTLGRFAAPLFR